MRVCVVFNPTARGDKARRFLRRLEPLARECALKPTTAAGSAVGLAAEAVREGFETIVAAGGDGTVNEVLNGIAKADRGLERARLGVLPLGTMNVFAKDLGLPSGLDAAWRLICEGRERSIDLPWAEFHVGGQPVRRCFAQLAGAGLDSRAIGFVNWAWKIKVGPLAYAVAGLRALRGRQPRVTVVLPDGTRASGELALVGNGTLYGGWVPMFPGACANDGKLDIRLLPRVGAVALFQFARSWLFRGGFAIRGERRFCVERFTLESEEPMPFQVDGDNAGLLPACFRVDRAALRVIAC